MMKKKISDPQASRLLVSKAIIIKKHGTRKASIIGQLEYWNSKPKMGCTHEGRKWVYITFEQLSEQLYASSRTIQRHIYDLVESGILMIKKLSRNKSQRTNYYAINYEALEKSIQDDEASNPQDSEPQNVEMTKWSRQNDEMVIHRVTNISNNKSNESEEEKNLPEGEELLPKKNTTVQDMTSIWNRIFEEAKKPKAFLSKPLAKRLMGAYIHKFDRNMDKFEHYCRLIASSPYLMSENFNLSIYWALGFSTIDRILISREFSVKRDLNFVPPRMDLEAEALEHIEAAAAKEGACSAKIRHLLLKKYGAATYVSWFKQVTLSGNDIQDIRIEAENRFILDNVRQKFNSLIQERV